MNNLESFIFCVLLYIIAYLIFPLGLWLGIFIFHVVFVPLLFKHSAGFRRKLVFANFVQYPSNINFENPAESGINGARNLYIEFDSYVDKCKIRIGLWHILPDSSMKKLEKQSESNKVSLDNFMDDELKHSKCHIIMYCHGNSNSRAAQHRIKLYQKFQEMNLHIIALDYRGFGDSTNVRLSEDGVVEDAFVTYKWILDKIKDVKDPPRVFLWGHSLGTGIASHMVGDLEYLSDKLDCETLPLPSALILEAPFNNMADEVRYHPLSMMVQWLPYHLNTFSKPFKTHFTFRSDEYLSKVKNLSVLILHAKDDWVVPFLLGVKLYRSIKASRNDKDAPVKLNSYETKLWLGHKWICEAQDLRDTLFDFCNVCPQSEHIST